MIRLDVQDAVNMISVDGIDGEVEANVKGLQCDGGPRLEG